MFGMYRYAENYDLISTSSANFKCSDGTYLGQGTGTQYSPPTYDYYDPNGLPALVWHDFVLKFDLEDHLIYLFYKTEGMEDYYNWSEVNDVCFWAYGLQDREDTYMFEVFKVYTRKFVAFDYFDISSPSFCTSGVCSNCDTQEDCLNADCMWEYVTGYDRWECHNVWIPYVSGCGMGYGCYGCTMQEDCENATPVGTCEWVDRGYGAGCYPVEVPPEEEVWEAPELESCEGLGTIETWLCEIRNFFAGMFMPTQEKVDNLRLTINNFKTKFPFNYAYSLSAFFTTIKTGLETDKNIPVEMFGHSGNVNFDFLNATGTIGGTSETFKNILYDFTSALIIFGFVLWLVSFIKRIF
jgi:hypothetical protein